MGKKQRGYNDIQKAHDTYVILKRLGINCTGNEFIGLIKSIGRVRAVDEFNFGEAHAGLTDNDSNAPKGKLEEKLGASSRRSEHAGAGQAYIDIHCLRGKALPGGFRISDPSSVYYKDGEFHIAYF